MKIQAGRVILMMLVATFCLVAKPAPAMSSSCFNCHDAADFQGKVVHRPISEKRCDKCHSSHVAKYEGLLKDTEKKLCFECHGRLEKELSQKEYLHKPVGDGDCSSCHAPHAGEYSSLLKDEKDKVCFACHKETKKKYSYSHRPFTKGNCDSCHSPHGASDSRMIKETDPDICLDCHKGDSSFKKVHLGRDPKEVQCLSCHNPHGSERRAMIRTERHEPFAKGNCRVCHDRKDGVDVCMGCHEDILPSFNQIYSHLSGTGTGNLCTQCHNPHVADRPGLLAGVEGEVCRSCHADTFERREKMLHKHPGWEKCTDCHVGHGTNEVHMLKNKPDNVCAQCHDRHISFSHPIGEKALDPRNGKPMTCITCHESNVGSMYKYHLRGSSERGLCINCHENY